MMRLLAQIPKSVALLAIAGALLSAPAAHAQPDLMLYAPTVDPVIVTATFADSDCVVEEGCVAAGKRRLLRFDTETRNIGPGDLVIGDPADPNGPYAEYYYFNTCHNEYKMNFFAEFRLKNGTGDTITARKPAFCILDTYRHSVNSAIIPKYNCHNQGIQAGWGDIYSSGLPCQWIDITGLPAGAYTLELEINPDRIFVETNYDNNIISVPVEITEPSNAPANDACGNSILISVDTPVLGSTEGATGVDMTSCADGDTADVWYLFVPSNAGGYVFSTCGSNFDTTLALYSTCNGTEISCNDDAGTCAGGAVLVATLNKLTPYFVRVAGFQGAAGDFKLTVTAASGEGEGEGEGEGGEWDAEIIADRDATLYANNTGAANGAGETLWAGTGPDSSARRALFHFGLESIPAGAQITGVEFEVTAITEGLETFCPNFELHRLTRAWETGTANPAGDEFDGVPALTGDTTWLHAVYPTSPWTTPGGDWAIAPSSGNSVGPAAKYAFTGPGLAADVQGWIDGAFGNHGWILMGLEDHEDTARPFAASESAKASFRPRLRVAYSPPAFMAMDKDQSGTIGLGEVLRVIQFYNSDGFHCEAGTEDGYAPGPGETGCAQYTADYAPQDWRVSLGEILRTIQMYNSPGYCACAGTEDGFCPGPC